MQLLKTGPLKLQVLKADGTLDKTLVLPAPDRGAPQLSWEADQNTVKIPGVGRKTRTLGYLPILKVSWGIYDDLPLGVPLGTSDGQRPCAADLLGLLSGPTGSVRIGSGEGWITVDAVQVAEINPVVVDLTQALTITFYGAKALPTRTLEAE